MFGTLERVPRLERWNDWNRIGDFQRLERTPDSIQGIERLEQMFLSSGLLPGSAVLPNNSPKPKLHNRALTHCGRYRPIRPGSRPRRGRQLELGNRWAALGDTADDLVAWDDRVDSGHDAAPLVAHLVEVGVADAAEGKGSKGVKSAVSLYAVIGGAANLTFRSDQLLTPGRCCLRLNALRLLHLRKLY
jgi:hypothetical protein